MTSTIQIMGRMAKLANLDLAAKKALFIKARKAYYNGGNSPLTDKEFDDLEDVIREEAPKWPALQKTGTAPSGFLGKKSVVSLSVPCSSLDKIVAEAPVGVSKWLAKVAKEFGSSYRVSEKLDGSSIQSVYKFGKLVQVATRGDGTNGKDITFLAPHMNLPAEIDCELPRLVIRHEAIMPLAAYTKKWAGQYDTARALSSAILNRQDAAPALADLHLVAVRVQFPKYSLSSGLQFLKTVGFRVARGQTVDHSHLSVESLTQAVAYFRSNSKYEIDGVVVYSEAPDLDATADRPAYARAFKVNDAADAFDTEIVAIKWQPSSFGVLVPKAIIRPVVIGGATIKQAAIYNARWALDRGVGVGAKVKILRSGDIIPKIVQVVEPAKFALPSKAEFGDWIWDKTKTGIQLTSAQDNGHVLTRQFARFFATLGMDQMAMGVAKKLVEAGYTDTAEVIQMDADAWGALPGVKSRAAVFADQMTSARAKSDIVQLMRASCVFDRGVGGTRIRSLQDSNPKLLSRAAAANGELEGLVAVTPGCGPAFAKLYARGLPKFYEWLDACGAVPSKKAKAKVAESAELQGQVFSWTGYRNKDEEVTVNKHGGAIGSFGKKTTVLFVTPGGKASGKADKAREWGIQVAHFNDYMKKVIK